LIRDHHEGYISWERFQENQARLRGNCVMKGRDESHRGAPREGRALLQGLVVCGRCGRRMFVNFGGSSSVPKGRTPQYRCRGGRDMVGGTDCQTIGSQRIDALVVEAFLDAVRPASVEVAAQAEQLAREEEAAAGRLWQLQIEKAEYEARRAERQFMAVEPENRLVVRSLEREWNARLAALEDVRRRAAAAQQQRAPLAAAELERLRRLAFDLEAVWKAPTTQDRDRKRLLRFPTRQPAAGGGDLGEVTWRPLSSSRLCSLLRNPVYAGTYAYGRRRAKKVIVSGQIRTVQQVSATPEEWDVCLRDAHPAYISWNAYLSNLQKLKSNRTTNGAGCGPAREGPALLVGLLVCGRCGRRMSPRYWDGSQQWLYACNGDCGRGEGTCWSVYGPPVDAAVEAEFLRTVVPDELELCLAVEREVDRQAGTLGEQWRLRLERADYEVRLAERRYKAVDPDNRVVARTLERQWETALQGREEVQRDYERARRERHVELSDEDRRRIRDLARDLPAVWRAPTTEPAERKAMLRLAIEAIALSPVEVPARETRVQLQWYGEAVSELRVPRPTPAERLRTPPPVVERLRALVESGLRDESVAKRLNALDLRTAVGRRWDVTAVQWARRREGIPRRAPDAPRSTPVPDRHPDGRYSVPGAARCFGVSQGIVRRWIAHGAVSAGREDFERHRAVWWLVMDEATAARLKAAGGRRAPRRPPLPDRRAEGWYSVPDAVRRFEVSPAAVHGWIRRGLVAARQEDLKGRRGVWWLAIDDSTARRLAAEVARCRRGRRPPLPDRHPDGRYSVPGAARAVGVDVRTIHGRRRRGLLCVAREDYGQHRGVWWIVADGRLEAAARLSREHHTPSETSPSE
jgi:hypothetical protein